MKIADKLLLMIAVACISVFTLAVTGLFGMGKIEDGLDSMNRNSIPSLVVLDEVGRDFLLLRVRMLNHIMNENPEQEKSWRRISTDFRPTSRTGWNAMVAN